MRNERNAHVKESLEQLVIGKKLKKKNLFNLKQVLLIGQTEMGFETVFITLD